MRCPKCSFQDTKVLDTRAGKNGASIRRRRECLACSHRFSTIEETLREDLVVIKRDGSREEFDSAKLLGGIKRAIEKRPIESDKVEDIVLQITTALQLEHETEIPSSVIGEHVMEQLKKLDQIAYVRFASVYKDFHDISQLAQEIKSLHQPS